MQLLISLDFETFPIGPGAVAPRIVCGSMAKANPEAEGGYDAWLWGHPDGLREKVEALLDKAISGEFKVVTHNGGFDYSCICATWPDLIPKVFAALYSGNCTDTQWREKLLNLSTHGHLDTIALPDGTSTPLRYSLGTLETHYLAIDRTAEKEDTENHWRVNYCALDGWPAAEYPDAAYNYATDDAVNTLKVYHAQESRKAQYQTASTATEEHKLLSSFCLRLETCWGMEVDQAEVARVRVEVDRIIEQNKSLLLELDILRPDVPARPHKHHGERASAALVEMMNLEHPGMDWNVAVLGDSFDWGPWVERLRDLGIKCTEPVAGSINTKELQAYAERLYQKLGQIPKMTDGGKSGNKKICLDAEVVEMLSMHDALFEQYHNRQALSKIRSGQLPVLESAPVIHFEYNALVETGRTSSYGGNLFPSTNGQNVPKEIEGIDPRRCYRPRAGRVFWDVDISNLELACVGQITFDLFGESRHKDLYNGGCDLHGYLAGQIVLHTAPNSEMAEKFIHVMTGKGWADDPRAVYEAFMASKKSEDPAVREFFKHYRSLAKPIGLGFPGGIGPVKMCTLAWTQYGVRMTEDEARLLRDIWRATYPEMPLYFDWIEGQVDQLNFSEDGSLYSYTTPLGMHRRGTTFCSIANGKAMQSPGAEVATLGNIEVVRACYDPTFPRMQSGLRSEISIKEAWERVKKDGHNVLYGCKPIAFVHDQIIGETTADASLWHAQVMEVSRLMIEAGKVPLPDMTLRTEPLLTSVWSKSAEPTFDANQQLVPWRPK